MIRPLDPAVRDHFLTELAAGCSLVHAARLAGTSKARIGKIVGAAQQAEARILEGELDANDLADWERWAIEFYVQMQVAVGELERGLVDRISNAAGGERPDWKAAAWLLERLFPERWAKRPPEKTNVQIGQIVGTQMVSQESIMDEAKRIALAAAQGAAEAIEAGEAVPDPGAETILEIEEIFDAPTRAEIGPATVADAAGYDTDEF